jgi:malonyl CoA-acyl carrier protein transacylase
MDATRLFLWDVGYDTVSASRFFTHPEPRTIEQFEEDRLEGEVTQEQIETQDMEGMPKDFIEQIARLKAKGYVESTEIVHCRVTRGITEEY